MKYSVDVNEEYQKSKSIFLRYSLLFSFLLTVTLVADTLLVVLAGEEYLLNLIIAIVVSVLFSWFAMYFFANIYKDINASYRYFKGYESGLKSVEEVILLKKSDELHYVNGLYVYPLYVSSFDGLSTSDKIIYTFDDKLNYKFGDKLTITTYQRVLIVAESHS